MPNQKSGWRSALDIIATVSMIAASSALVWAIVSSANQPPFPKARQPSSARPPKPVPRVPVSLEGLAIQGQTGARVAVIEFSDFECPYCIRFHEQTYPTLLRNYVNTGKILFGWRHLPLERIHPAAFTAAEAAECARLQEKFWPMVDELFRAPRRLDRDDLSRAGERISLDMSAFQQCMTGLVASEVRDDLAAAKELSVSSTPSFLIGIVTGDRLVKVVRHESGAIPTEAFTRMLDDLLAKISQQ